MSVRSIKIGKVTREDSLWQLRMTSEEVMESQGGDIDAGDHHELMWKPHALPQSSTTPHYPFITQFRPIL